jgi:hypothetical protein
MPSNEGDYGGKPAKNRMSKSVAQKRGWRFTDEVLQ